MSGFTRSSTLLVMSLTGCLAAQVCGQSSEGDPILTRSRLGQPVTVEALAIGMQGLFETDPYFEAVAHRRELEFPWLKVPVWTIPDQPTWEETPFNDNAWQTQYQSLAWVVAYGHGFDLTGDTTYLDRMQHLVFDYIEKNPYPGDTSYSPILPDLDSDLPTRSGWSSMATANRAETVTYVVKKWLGPRLSDHERVLLADFLRVHGWYLDRYLKTDRGANHNHGLMAVFALLKMVRSFPEMEMSAVWYEHVLERAHVLIDGMVDAATGASTEQSAYYHYFATEYFLELRELMAALDEPLDTDLDAVIEKMLVFAAIVTYPDGTLPAYGDTKHNASVRGRLKRLAERWGGENGMVEFALSEGRRGTPFPSVTTVPSEGYVVLRPDSQFTDGRSWREQTVVFADFGDTVRVHGHDDAMSLLAYLDGEAVLVDGSGPYTYMPEYRPYVVARSRGNTLVVDGYERIDNAANLISTYEDAGFIGATGRLEQRGVSVSRTVSWLEQGILLVVDHAVPDDGEIHLYSLYHHYPPEANVTTRSDGFSITTSGGHEIRQQTIGSANYQPTVLQPKPHEEQLSSPGWVITGFKEASPAPVARIDMASSGESWFVTVIHSAPETSDVLALLERTGDDLELQIGERRFSYSLREDRLSLSSSD